jgi:hypothetical protein
MISCSTIYKYVCIQYCFLFFSLVFLRKKKKPHPIHNKSHISNHDRSYIVSRTDEGFMDVRICFKRVLSYESSNRCVHLRHVVVTTVHYLLYIRENYVLSKSRQSRKTRLFVHLLIEYRCCSALTERSADKVAKMNATTYGL